MSNAARASSIVVMFMVLVAAGVAVSVYLSSRAIQENDQKLCTVVDLVVRHPVPKPPDPKADPSRESSYEFYQAFLKVKKDYGCPG